MGSAHIPIALIQESQLAAEEINMVTGIYQGDIGAPNQATSGKQEIARQQAGAIATFNYSDNMAKAIERTWELLIDLIPKVYTTKRSMRVLGQDGAEDYVTIYDVAPDPKTGQLVTVHDLSVGKYDTTVTVGPNFTTRRQEAAETYQGLLQGNPDLFPIIGDLVFKSMDLPYAEDISDRMKTMLPPEIRQGMEDGQGQSPEVMQAMQQANQAMQMVEQQMAQVQEAGAEVQQEATANEQTKAEIEKLTANLEADQARFEAKIAKEIANITKLQAKVSIDQIEAEKEGYIESERADMNAQVAGQMAQAVLAIQQLAEQFNNQAIATMDKIEEKTQEQKPRITKIISERVNGKLEAVPVYDDAG